MSGPPPLVQAAAALRAAVGFSRRHAAWIVAISLIPGVQRCYSTLAQPAAGWQGLLELITLAARLLLIALIAYVATRGVRRRGHPVRYLREHWPDLLVQLIVLAGLIAVFGVVLEQGVVLLLPMEDRRTYTALVLLVKNPTVIAFTFVWLVLAVCEAVQYTHAIPTRSYRGRSPAPQPRKESR